LVQMQHHKKPLKKLTNFKTTLTS